MLAGGGGVHRGANPRGRGAAAEGAVLLTLGALLLSPAVQAAPEVQAASPYYPAASASHAVAPPPQPIQPPQAGETVEFSADVVRFYSGKVEGVNRGRMMVGPAGIRTESTLNGQPVQLLFLPGKRLAAGVIPNHRAYFEQEGVEVKRPPLPDEAESPCRTQKGYACRNLGPATLGGRSVVRWEVSVSEPAAGVQGQPSPPPGQAPGQAQGGTSTRRWQLWVDPRLKIAIREEYGDGLTVELLNIREEPQSPALFEIPAGFRRLASPQEGEALLNAPASGGGSAPPGR
ncbi:MAG: hypothetical protein HQL51_04865 [Magnetococcales bacterium]|nr:hypothetical protein [Magnetococcales bacterium]